MRKAVVLLLLAACGDDSGIAPDGARGDGGDGVRDGSRGDAYYGNAVTVVVTQAGAPRAGVQVYFQNADSTTAGSALTDATGTASQIMTAGGYVTAIDPFVIDAPLAQSDELYTIAGVQPGDSLAIASPSAGGVAPMETDFTLTIPYAPTAYSYSVWTACGSAGFGHDDSGSTAAPSQTIELAGCPAIVDALVTATDEYGAVVGSFWAMQQPIANGATIDLSSHTYEAPIPALVQAQFLGTELGFQRLLVTEQGQIWDIAGLGGIHSMIATAELTGPNPDGATRVTEESFRIDDTTELVETWGPTWADETIDAASMAIATFDTAPAFSVANHAISWAAGDGVTPDFVVAQAGFSRAGRTWSWNIAAPTPTSVTFPTLPAAGAEWNPLSNDGITVQVAAYSRAWDAARPAIFGGVAFPTGTGTDAVAIYSPSGD